MTDAIMEIGINADKVIKWLNEGILTKELTHSGILKGLPLLNVYLLDGNEELIHSLISVMLEMIE